jgi:hypothetical protein
MYNLPSEIICVLAPFLTLFSQPVSKNALTLIIGALLCKKQRTVAACLRALNLQDAAQFTNYHRVLNKAKWSSLYGAKILLGLILKSLPLGASAYVVLDDTLERRNGKKIKALGCFRDAIRSTSEKTFCCFGLRWLVFTVIIFPPWCKQPWALPFLTLLTEAEIERKEQGKRHKKKLDWARQGVKQIVRWFKDIKFILVGDSEFACIEFGKSCVKSGVTLVSRLKMNTRLFDFPIDHIGKRKVGRPRKLGKRLPGFKELINDKNQHWQAAEVRSYGGRLEKIQYLTGSSLLYRSPLVLPIRWVLIKRLNSEDVIALFSTDLHMDPKVIIETFILRWNIEVTFELSRENLGIESQRQWSDLAIQRTTPALFALYSISTLIGMELHKANKINVESTAWYKKEEATFSDILITIRKEIWRCGDFFNMANLSEVEKKFAENIFPQMIQMLASAG